MSEDKTYTNGADECPEACPAVSKLNRSIDTLVEKTGKMQTLFESSKAPSDAFVDGYLRMVNELVLNLGANGKKLAKALKQVSAYEMFKPYIMATATAVGYDGQINGKKAIPLTLRWYEGLAKTVADRMKANPVKDTRIKELEARVKELDKSNTDMRKVIADQAEKMELYDSRLKEYLAQAKPAEGGSKNE